MLYSPESINYQRIASAIEYIKRNFKEQPSLEKIAGQINLSPFHFQRLFTDWAGVSPKQFAHYLSLNYAKQVLAGHKTTLSEAAYQSGLSGTGRLHDLFVKVEGMTPGEFKNGGANLQINYHSFPTLFGLVFIASTHKGICYMAFVEDETSGRDELLCLFPRANYTNATDTIQQSALQVVSGNYQGSQKIKAHLKGTDFQLKVWEALLKIPMGKLSSYGKLAAEIGNPKASRAVGSAIGENPVAFIIPCHRVIQSSGNYGQYRWGSTRKSALIAWEAAKTNRETDGHE